MSKVLTLVMWPDPRLAKCAKKVTAFDQKLAALTEDMQATMQHHEGWGLAAPQVGEDLAVCLVSATEETNIAATPMVLVNPKIVEKSGRQASGEGCLSVPLGIVIRVPRALTVKVAAQDLKGNPFMVSATGIGAVVLQHEIDHLNGLTIVSYLPFNERQKLRHAVSGRKGPWRNVRR